MNHNQSSVEKEKCEVCGGLGKVYIATPTVGGGYESFCTYCIKIPTGEAMMLGLKRKLFDDIKTLAEVQLELNNIKKSIDDVILGIKSKVDEINKKISEISDYFHDKEVEYLTKKNL